MDVDVDGVPGLNMQRRVFIFSGRLMLCSKKEWVIDMTRIPF